ncbi:MAG: hypothetical protein QF360_05175, partial [Phycisphaerales bacterium]|nr:hypothetical protein [Phycisphaerales bacterium]
MRSQVRVLYRPLVRGGRSLRLHRRFLVVDGVGRRPTPRGRCPRQPSVTSSLRSGAESCIAHSSAAVGAFGSTAPPSRSMVPAAGR